MPDIHIHRDHNLGLPRARRLARGFTADIEKKFELACTVTEGDDEDLIEFKRSGVSGTVRVSGTALELNAKLGLLMGAFSKTIEAEIGKKLDALLGGTTKGNNA